MAANRLAQTMREQLGIGRVLPLGGPADGSWITERAAADALRAAVGAPAGARLHRLRLSLADPGHAPEPVVPPPPSALPPGPLRIEAAIEVSTATVPDRSLPAVADQVRAALLEASVRDLGLVVSRVDLLVSGLVEAPEGAMAGRGTATVSAPSTPSGEAAVTPPDAGSGGASPPYPAGAEGPEGIAAVTRKVPGVARLTPVLGGLSRPVRLTDGHALIQLAIAAGYRALDVSSAVRHAVAAAPSAPSTVAVLVTAVEQQ
ncbi:hypothetical protein ACFY12_23410 [Streptomyces sp. NPDC001339]|uniref:hypothetical protein n=1 Tax=Streptomyces sp. NPDC001339 TaxID=3364563 RepID=UPI0036A71AC4